MMDNSMEGRIGKHNKEKSKEFSEINLGILKFKISHERLDIEDLGSENGIQITLNNVNIKIDKIIIRSEEK
jgi:CO dehydrogenase/acetyl-CoA synthase beta subunit